MMLRQRLIDGLIIINTYSIDSSYTLIYYCKLPPLVAAGGNIFYYICSAAALAAFFLVCVRVVLPILPLFKTADWESRLELDTRCTLWEVAALSVA